ncbi:MAG: hypothetical protein EOO09_00685 [Chitinophagaceae bacterium]|nr:MAG: hypothetical protein EOO09_00685 [Chitinophagaceae bacterium]
MRTFKTARRLSACLLVLAAILSLQSCTKDNDSSSDQVILLSFGPTGAMHGDTLRFIGKNLNQVTSIQFTGATVDKTAFTQQTAELIKVVVPESTERGFVTLKTAQGDIVTKTILNLEVLVTISGMPAQARPGDNITITGEYLNWVTNIRFAKDKWVDSVDFVSAGLNELVVKVPMDAESGPLVFYYGGSGKGPLEIETPASLELALPAITSFGPNPAVREQNLTITGTDLDLVKGILFKGKTTADTVFESRSATELVIRIPAEANKGKISLVAHSLITIESAESLRFEGDLADLPPLAYAFYIDKLENGWQNWGWGSTVDFENTDNVRDGAAAAKLDYTGQWSGLNFANGSVATGAFTELSFSIYGTAGTNGKKITVKPKEGSGHEIVIEEGKWVDFVLTKAQIGNPATVTELLFQNQDWTGLVYVDHVGFR